MMVVLRKTVRSNHHVALTVSVFQKIPLFLTDDNGKSNRTTRIWFLEDRIYAWLYCKH